MRRRSRLPYFTTLLLLGFGTAAAVGADLKEAKRLLISGQYQEVIQDAREALVQDGDEQDWHLLLIRALLAVGQYEEAREAAEAAVDAVPRSVRVCLEAREAFLHMGQVQRAQSMLETINSLASRRMWAYQEPPDLLALGRAAVLLGADPRRVLEMFYDRAKQRDPELREVYLNSGQLALDKSDFALASRVYGEGLAKFPDDPDLNFGLALAFASSDRLRMMQALDATLFANSNHVGGYLLLADHAIDGEAYDTAREMLDHVWSVNPWDPEGWAYAAVLAHLENDPAGEREAREKGLRFWDTNPQVDYLVGKKLSQKYRFSEAAAYQQRCLAFDPGYLPAKSQLAQDLLRLGRETEGWQLAKEVHEADEYNVAAYNLVTLHDTLDRFTTLTNDFFILRMGADEAPVYGQRVLELLEQAREHLCAKYELKLDFPVTVEIFPEQKDFGVRTFGMPDNPGFLGVCFGPVITANSPASQAASPANWEAVLWHEFCHVITLTLTRNKMPRWLSEGISVYEELQEDPTWGQTMTPEYREMVLGEEMAPVGELSAAFLAPKSNQHLQFAYYQSALVVEFLVDRYGLDSLESILRDLGEGQGINESISQRCAPLEEIETAFVSFAQQRAEALGKGLDWEKVEVEEVRDPLPDWVAGKERNYYRLGYEAGRLLEEEMWEEAKQPLRTLIKFYPEQAGSGNAYDLLAYAHRQLGETEEERDVLTALADRANDALEAYARLIDLGEEAENWSAVVLNSERYIAVNPLRAAPYAALGRACEALGKKQEAVAAYRTLLLLNPRDPAQAHFRLASLLHEHQDPQARRHVLQALEEAPRFRAAHRLLLDIVNEQ